MRRLNLENTLDLDLVVDSNDSGILGDAKLVRLDGVLDGVLGLEDLVEFLELSNY